MSNGRAHNLGTAVVTLLSGAVAYMIGFLLDGRKYKIVWPVLPTKKSEQAARIQATTLMYHDVKAKIVSSLVLGNRVAFFQYLMLPDGRTTSEVADDELAFVLPDLNLPLLAAGDVTDGEYTEQ